MNPKTVSSKLPSKLSFIGPCQSYPTTIKDSTNTDPTNIMLMG